MDISDKAFNYIVEQEDSNEAYYTKFYQHFDWPEGASGPTVGIGYDCGYVTVDECKQDWDGIISEEAISTLSGACGFRAGSACAFVQRNRNTVTITWDQALKEFREREIPKWMTRLTNAVPNCDCLSGDSVGALLSLVYNRGCSFDLPGPRYAEMRAIKMYMLTKEFDKIPGEFLSMRRLWPRGGDLWNRRTTESQLFANGLNTVVAPDLA